MSRRELREHIYRILFTTDFYVPDEALIREQMELYFTHPDGDGIELPEGGVSEEDREEILTKAQAVAQHLTEIDALLDATSTGWKTSRMAKADLAVLRLAVYEMEYDDAIPVGVAINEAVLLARKFGGDDSSSFVNGVLAKLSRKDQAHKTGSAAKAGKAAGAKAPKAGAAEDSAAKASAAGDDAATDGKAAGGTEE